MLDEKVLKDAIENGLKEIGKDALAQAWLAISPSKSDAAERTSENFAEAAMAVLSEPIAYILSSAISGYIKNAELYGEIVTVGPTGTQTAIVNSTSTPTVNGTLINTIGIR